jgi:hypothetical protein
MVKKRFIDIFVNNLEHKNGVKKNCEFIPGCVKSANVWSKNFHFQSANNKWEKITSERRPQRGKSQSLSVYNKQQQVDRPTALTC